jgi:hypothetical protein
VSRGLVHIRATLNRVGRAAKERPFGRFLQNRRKIGTEAKGDEKLSENVHRADQHVNRNVEQCWLLAFENLVSEDLQSPADNKEPKLGAS